MQNVSLDMLKKCIFLSTEQYTKILQELFRPNLYVDFINMEIIWTEDGSHSFNEADVLENLAEYFGVSKITNVHMDYSDETGIWICYED